MERRELSKIDFDMIDDAFEALLQSSHPDPVDQAKIVDLRDKFRDAFTGWLEIEEAVVVSTSDALAADCFQPRVHHWFI